VQDVTNPVTLSFLQWGCMLDVPFLLDCLILFHFSYDQSTSLLHPSNLPGICDPLSEVSKFQHHTKLCSKLSTLLVFSINLTH
jgi:hypothetical protein